MQLHPIGETTLDVIESERTLYVPCNLHPLPRGQIFVNFPASRVNLGLHRFHFGIDVDFVSVGMLADLLEPALEFQDRLFEIERLKSHGVRDVKSLRGFPSYNGYSEDSNRERLGH